MALNSSIVQHSLNIEAIRSQFPVLHQEVNGRPLIYFDNAATNQKPEVVINAIEVYYKTNNGGVVDCRSLWIDKMIHCVTASAYFSSQRMVEEYNRLMWKAIQ